jgi:aconitate hydratase
VNKNSFGSASTLTAGNNQYRYYSLEALEKKGIANTSRIPNSIKILIENLLRMEDGRTVKPSDIEYAAQWKIGAKAQEINFRIL